MRFRTTRAVPLFLAAMAASVAGQGPQPPAAGPTNWTTAEDHQHMLRQLGIRALRPGPSGNESAPNRANDDEATANPYPDLPEVLTTKHGRRVWADRLLRPR